MEEQPFSPGDFANVNLPQQTVIAERTVEGRELPESREATTPILSTYPQPSIRRAPVSQPSIRRVPVPQPIRTPLPIVRRTPPVIRQSSPQFRPIQPPTQQPPTQLGYPQQAPTQFGYPQQPPTQLGYPQHAPTQLGYPQQPPTQFGYPQQISTSGVIPQQIATRSQPARVPQPIRGPTRTPISPTRGQTVSPLPATRIQSQNILIPPSVSRIRQPEQIVQTTIAVTPTLPQSISSQVITPTLPQSATQLPQNITAMPSLDRTVITIQPTSAPIIELPQQIPIGQLELPVVEVGRKKLVPPDMVVDIPKFSTLIEPIRAPSLVPIVIQTKVAETYVSQENKDRLREIVAGIDVNKLTVSAAGASSGAVYSTPEIKSIAKQLGLRDQGKRKDIRLRILQAIDQINS